jgi:hypothetical protein
VSPLQRIRADLTERRLWPIVLLLVVALVAVPVVLRPDAGDPAAAAPSAPATPPAAEAPSPAATMAAVTAVLEGTETSKTRGTRRDPFAAPTGAKATAKAEVAATAGKSAAPASASPPASGSGSSPGSPSTRSAPAPASAPTPKSGQPDSDADADPTARTTYRLRRADIRFDDADVVHDAIRLRAFPSPKRPVALYLGATAGGKAAAFVITTEAEVSGDGTCRPRKRLCTHLLLKPGEEAMLTVGATQHTLRLLRIRTDKTTSARVAERFYTRESSKGRCVLDILDYVAFDAETGTVAPHDDADRCRYVISEASADGAEPRTVGAR